MRRSGSGRKVTGWSLPWLSRTVNPMRPMSESLTTASVFPIQPGPRLGYTWMS